MNDEDSIYTPTTSQIVTQEYTAGIQIDTSSSSYIYPRQVGTGSTRGTQTIGVGNINLDGSNNQITLTDSSGANSIVIGEQTTTSTQTGVAASSLTTTTGAFGISISDSNNASITLGFNSSGDVEELFNDSSTNRLLIGQNSSGVEGVYISAPGVDVTTADPNTPGQLIFNSNQQTFKVVLSGQNTTSQATLTNNEIYIAQTVIPHNLGYIPIFYVFAELQVLIGTNSGSSVVSSYLSLPQSLSITSSPTYSGTLDVWQMYAAADATNLYIQQYMTSASSGGAGTLSAIPFIYYLIQPTFSS